MPARRERRPRTCRFQVPQWQGYLDARSFQCLVEFPKIALSRAVARSAQFSLLQAGILQKLEGGFIALARSRQALGLCRCRRHWWGKGWGRLRRTGDAFFFLDGSGRLFFAPRPCMCCMQVCERGDDHSVYEEIEAWNHHPCEAEGGA